MFNANYLIGKIIGRLGYKVLPSWKFPAFHGHPVIWAFDLLKSRFSNPLLLQIGANDGIIDDPLHSLISGSAGVSAWLVEPLRPDCEDIRRHPVYRRHLERFFPVHSGDGIRPFVPGVFTSAERLTHSKARSRTGSYSRVVENPNVDFHNDYGACSIPFSFVGRSETHRIR